MEITWFSPSSRRKKIVCAPGRVSPSLLFVSRSLTPRQNPSTLSNSDLSRLRSPVHMSAQPPAEMDVELPDLSAMRVSAPTNVTVVALSDKDRTRMQTAIRGMWGPNAKLLNYLSDNSAWILLQDTMQVWDEEYGINGRIFTPGSIIQSTEFCSPGGIGYPPPAQ